MDGLRNNKILVFLFAIFCIVSVLFIGYATYTMRGLYLDGVFYFLSLLDNIDKNVFSIVRDPGHSRAAFNVFYQVPVYLSVFLFGIKSKFLLAQIYTFFQFIWPILFLIWNYYLTKRTQRIDIFFWSLFSYSLLILPLSIFSVVEIIFGLVLNFVLYNYLASKIDYTKKDIFLILFLIIIMFQTYEYIIALGILFFFVSFYYAKKEDKKKNKIVKYLIGLGSLCASIYNVMFLFSLPSSDGEVCRFLFESINFFYMTFNLNTIISVATLFILALYCFLKKEINRFQISIIFIVYIGLFLKLMLSLNYSINPMFEGHLRTVPCWASILIFSGIFVFDVFGKQINSVKMNNFIAIVLVSAIFHSCWQIVNTYYWDKNIKYMKSELNKESNLLYLPSEHPVISSFFAPKLRRYIAHSIYAATSIAFSETYEIKTLLMHYDNEYESDNIILREFLFVPKNYPNMISIPFGCYIMQKNSFWDLTKVSEALSAYNKKNNIKTNNDN